MTSQYAPKIEVYVATHKPIDFALPDYCQKIQVNAESNGQWPGYLHDNDTPDNISIKNPNYCELTALYSMWKNCTADIQGLFHYRRFISGSEDSDASENIRFLAPFKMCAHSISEQQIIKALGVADIILCLPYPPYPLNGLEDLRRLVYWNDIKAMCEVIRENYPDYMPSLNHIFNLEHINYYNMFIARREFVNDYCAWLFDVLGRLEGRISLEGYDTQHRRIYGYLAEVLLNVYIHRHNLRRKNFQIIQLYEKGFPRYMLSCIKRVMKKIPALRRLVYALQIRNVARKEFSEKRHESMTEFLAGGKKRYDKKITDASSLMDYFRFLSFPGAKCFETTETIYAYADIRDLIYNAMFIVFIPKSGADPLKIIGEIQSVIREKEASNAGIVVLSRFVPSYEMPDSLKNALIESGCRILDEA